MTRKVIWAAVALAAAAVFFWPQPAHEASSVHEKNLTVALAGYRQERATHRADVTRLKVAIVKSQMASNDVKVAGEAVALVSDSSRAVLTTTNPDSIGSSLVFRDALELQVSACDILKAESDTLRFENDTLTTTALKAAASSGRALAKADTVMFRYDSVLVAKNRDLRVAGRKGFILGAGVVAVACLFLCR